MKHRSCVNLKTFWNSLNHKAFKRVPILSHKVDDKRCERNRLRRERPISLADAMKDSNGPFGFSSKDLVPPHWQPSHSLVQINCVTLPFNLGFDQVFYVHIDRNKSVFFFRQNIKNS